MPSLPCYPSGRVRDAPRSPDKKGWITSMCKDTSLYQFETEETAANQAPRSSSKVSIGWEESSDRARLNSGTAEGLQGGSGQLSGGHGGAELGGSRSSNGSHLAHAHSSANGTGSVPGIWMATGNRSRPPPRPPTSTVAIPPPRGCLPGCCLDLRLWLWPPSSKLPQVNANGSTNASTRIEGSAQSNTLRILSAANANANGSANASTGSLVSEGSLKGSRRDSNASDKGGDPPVKRSWRNSFVMRGRRLAQRVPAATPGNKVAPLGSAERPRPIKVVLVGGSACGKTALFHSYINNSFPSVHESTVQAGLGAKLVVINEGKENEMWAGLQVLDTPPPPAPNAAYISGADVVALILDVTSKDSLRSLQTLQQELLFAHQAKGLLASGRDLKSEPPLLVLIATKTDLKSDRVISSSQVKDISRELGAWASAEVSPKQDPPSVSQAFRTCVLCASTRFSQRPHTSSGNFP